MIYKGVLSARGERVDFDLLKIKQQIAAAPKTTTVKAREDFIDQKFKRRLNRQTREVIDQVTEANSTPILPIDDIEEPEEFAIEEEVELTPTTVTKTKKG